MKELTTEQQKKFSQIRSDFKDRLIEDDFDYDDFEIIGKPEEIKEDNKEIITLHNQITIGRFDVRTSVSSLKQVENTMMRLLDKFKDRIPSYIG